MKDVKDPFFIIAIFNCLKRRKKWKKALALSKALRVIGEIEGMSERWYMLWELERELWCEIHGEKDAEPKTRGDKNG